MKIGLISFHNAFNYGAGLQAYALQEGIKEAGYSCEYINYINQRRADGYKISVRTLNAVKNKKWKTAVKSVCGAPFVWNRGRKFNKFYKQNLLVTEKVYSTCESVKELCTHYDKFIVGSDQVWNAEHNGTDLAYFLGFENDMSKTISYASSFGMDSIPADLVDWYREGIGHIGCLSTREKIGVRLIQELTGRKAQLVLDPVFLINREKWERVVAPKKENRRYTFYYINAEYNLGHFSADTGWEDGQKHILSSSVSAKDFFKSDRKVTFAMAPGEFLRQISDAELVVTTSFHCLAFSIIFHKPFVVILSGDSGRDERLLNLLKITGLENRIMNPNIRVTDILKPIDYETVDSRLSKYIQYSKDFLLSAIAGEKQE